MQLFLWINCRQTQFDTKYVYQSLIRCQVAVWSHWNVLSLSNLQRERKSCRSKHTCKRDGNVVRGAKCKSQCNWEVVLLASSMSISDVASHWNGQLKQMRNLLLCIHRRSNWRISCSWQHFSFVLIPRAEHLAVDCVCFLICFCFVFCKYFRCFHSDLCKDIRIVKREKNEAQNTWNKIR